MKTLILLLMCIDWAPIRPPVPPVPKVVPNHATLYKQAVKENKPLVIFINEKSRVISGMITYETPEFYLYKGVLVGVPVNGILYNVELPSKTSDIEIANAISKAKTDLPRQLTGRTDVRLGSAGRIETRTVRCDGKQCVVVWE